MAKWLHATPLGTNVTDNPAAPASITSERTGTRIRRDSARHSTIEGEPDPIVPETIVFVHGVGLNHAVWAPQVKFFRQTHHVITYDTLGHGESPQPPEDSDLSVWVEQLLDVLDSSDVNQAHVVGHSMGALICIAFALAQPHKTLSITPIAGVYDRTPDHALRAQATARALASQGPKANLEDALKRWFIAADSQDPTRSKAIQLCREWLSAADPVGYARAYAAFASQSDNFVGKLHEIQCPALFLSAEFDPNSTPAMSDAMAAAMATSPAHGRSHMIEDERHMLPLIAPEKVNPIIQRFITRSTDDPGR